MGHDLYRMILDGATSEWTVQMRMVACVIANDARDPDDTRGPGTLSPDGLPWSSIPLQAKQRPDGTWRDGLTDKTGMSEQAIGRAISALAAIGYDMRQPLRGRDGQPLRDRRGRIMTSVRGHSTDYQVPYLPPRSAPDRSSDTATYPGNEAARSSPVTTYEADRSSPVNAKVIKNDDPISSDPPQRSSPQAARPLSREALAAKSLKATDDEIEMMITLITRNRDVKDPSKDKYLATAIWRDQGQDLLDQVRRQARNSADSRPSSTNVKDLCPRHTHAHAPEDCPDLRAGSSEYSDPDAPPPPPSPGKPKLTVVGQCAYGPSCTAQADDKGDDDYHDRCRYLAKVKGTYPAPDSASGAA